jgi:hypothetical protein
MRCSIVDMRPASIRPNASRISGEWQHEDHDLLDGDARSGASIRSTPLAAMKRGSGACPSRSPSARVTGTRHPLMRLRPGSAQNTKVAGADRQAQRAASWGATRRFGTPRSSCRIRAALPPGRAYGRSGPPCESPDRRSQSASIEPAMSFGIVAVNLGSECLLRRAASVPRRLSS